MSSAPPGWHRQPDGRERFWDGERWTERFREPTSAPTEQIPVGETRNIPTSDADGYAGAGPGDYAPPPPGGHYQDYPREPYDDAEGAGRGRGGVLRGCLVALLILFVVAVIGVVLGWWLLTRGADDPAPTSTATTAGPDTATETASQTPTETPTEDPTDAPGLPGLPTALPTDLPTELPTEWPTELPSGFPTEFPTGLPTLPGSGESVEVALGEEFTLGPARIQAGWTVAELSLGFRTVSMTVVPTETGTVPVLFTLTFLEGGAELAQTACSAPLGTVGEPADVSCVPMRAPAEDADRVRASGYGGG